MSNKYPIGGYAPGNYHNRCSTCECSFFGDKGSFQCETCGTKSQAEWDTLTPEQQLEQQKRNVEIYNELIKNSSTEQLSGTDQVCGKTELNNLATISTSPQVAVWVKTEDRMPSIGDYYYCKVDFKPDIEKLIVEFSFGKWIFRNDEEENIEVIEWLNESASKESDAVEVLEWMIKNGIVINYDGEIWETPNNKLYTPQQLYDLYQQLKK